MLLLTFIQTSGYLTAAKSLGLSDEQQQMIENIIAEDPKAGRWKVEFVSCESPCLDAGRVEAPA